MNTLPAQMPLRLPGTLHQALKEAASKEGVSLNQYCLYLLARHSGSEEVLNQKKGEELLRFLEEARALQKAMKPDGSPIVHELPKETPKSRWRSLYANNRSRAH